MLATIYHFLEYAFFIVVGILILYNFMNFIKVSKDKILWVLSITAVVLLLFSVTCDVVISRKINQALPKENESNIITKIDTKNLEPKNAMAKNLVKTLTEENIEIITIFQKEGSPKYYIQVTATDVFEFDFDKYELFELLPQISFDHSPLVE